MITLLPQAVLNYRLKSVTNLSLLAVILWSLGVEVSGVWAKALLIISVAYGLFTGIAIVIGCQMRFDRIENEERSTSKYLEFIANYLLLLLCSLVVGLAFYYLFEWTRSHLWIINVIGIVLPTAVDALGFALIVILGSITAIISVCLLERIDIVPWISFIINLFVLKMIIFRGREARQSNQISPMEKSQMPGK